MVSFVCGGCQETLKKPKLDAHASRCRYAQFSCLDCGVDFQGVEYRMHTQCISEDQKYQGALYKPKKGEKADTPAANKPKKKEKANGKKADGMKNSGKPDGKPTKAEKSEPSFASGKPSLIQQIEEKMTPPATPKVLGPVDTATTNETSRLLLRKVAKKTLKRAFKEDNEESHLTLRDLKKRIQERDASLASPLNEDFLDLFKVTKSKEGELVFSLI